MEDNRILDVSNELHMFSLHYVVLPCANAQMDDFVNGWINHGLSSAHNKTLRQLWILGMQQSAALCTTVSEEMFGVSHDFVVTHQPSIFSCNVPPTNTHTHTDKLNSLTISSSYLFLSTGGFSGVWYRLARTFTC